jgi:hypothetical protein
MSLKRTNHTGLAWILLACGISILWGSTLGPEANRWVDFKAVYYGTRCLIEHHNPYNVSELDSVYQSESRDYSSQSIQDHQGVTLYVNLPATFIFVTPFAMLPWGPAHVLWMALTAGAFILAALLTWNLAASYSPRVTLLLLCILLANCEGFFVAGNTAGIVVSLCVVAVWCFLQERFVPAGILCMAVSLAIKPHDAGLVWLYFLLAGGVYRKRALQSLFVATIVGIAAFLWVSHVAPHWIGDWQNNMAAISSHGGLNDPSLDSPTGRAGGMVIDLQSVLIIFKDDPRIYNTASYLVCGALLLAWSIRTFRSRLSRAGAWFALAAVVPLTMLVTYHRPWDAKLLLLTIPACAMLWAEGGAIRWLALLVTTVGVVLTADIPLVILLILTRNLRISTAGLSGQFLKALLTRPTPLALLVMGIFYLWVYLRRDPLRVSSSEPGEPRETPLAPTPA